MNDFYYSQNFKVKYLLIIKSLPSKICLCMKEVLFVQYFLFTHYVASKQKAHYLKVKIMKTLHEIKLGYRVHLSILSGFSYEDILEYLSSKKNMDGRILLSLRDYLATYLKAFDNAKIFFTAKINKRYPNGSMEGLVKLIN